MEPHQAEPKAIYFPESKYASVGAPESDKTSGFECYLGFPRFPLCEKFNFFPVKVELKPKKVV